MRIYPAIDLFEKNGFISKLDLYIFEEVCRTKAAWRGEKYEHLPVSVNMSRLHLYDRSFPERLEEIAKKYEIDMTELEIEITESASIISEKVFLDNLYALKRFGVTFSLDDFGTGQSNLNYIVSMPVDIVKFDRGMTLSYFQNAKAKYVMDAAMMMIKGMHLEIVSEGIENEEQLKIMEALGIQYIQGYYFSKPLPVNKFVEFIEESVEHN